MPLPANTYIKYIVGYFAAINMLEIYCRLNKRLGGFIVFVFYMTFVDLVKALIFLKKKNCKSYTNDN